MSSQFEENNSQKKDLFDELYQKNVNLNKQDLGRINTLLDKDISEKSATVKQLEEKEELLLQRIEFYESRLFELENEESSKISSLRSVQNDEEFRHKNFIIQLLEEKDKLQNEIEIMDAGINSKIDEINDLEKKYQRTELAKKNLESFIIKLSAEALNTIKEYESANNLLFDLRSEILDLTKKQAFLLHDIKLKEDKIRLLDEDTYSLEQNKIKLEEDIRKFQMSKNELVSVLKNLMLQEKSLKGNLEFLYKNLEETEDKKNIMSLSFIEIERKFDSLQKSFRDDIIIAKERLNAAGKKLVEKELLLIQKESEIREKSYELKKIESELYRREKTLLLLNNEEIKLKSNIDHFNEIILSLKNEEELLISHKKSLLSQTDEIEHSLNKLTDKFSGILLETKNEYEELSLQKDEAEGHLKEYEFELEKSFNELNRAKSRIVEMRDQVSQIEVERDNHQSRIQSLLDLESSINSRKFDETESENEEIINNLPPIVEREIIFNVSDADELRNLIKQIESPEESPDKEEDF